MASSTEPDDLFPESTAVPVTALFLGEYIATRPLHTMPRVADRPLMVRVGAAGFAVVFRYGAVVLFGVTADEESAFRSTLAPHVRLPADNPEFERAVLETDPEREEGAGDGTIHVHRMTAERMQVVASILAKSVCLAHYELAVAEASNLIEPFAAGLQRRSWFRPQSRRLLQHLGETLAVEHKMIGRVEVREKPELLWERPSLERLYVRMEDEYELAERDQALGRKLALISRTAETVLGLLHHRRTLRVEWYIVILIVIEIILSLYEKLAG